MFTTYVHAQRGAQKILRAYTNATLAERRVGYVRESFPLDADVPVRQREAVIVISSNTRGIHLILNWACGCERKGMADVRDHTLILATDDAAHEYAARMGFHSLHPELFGHAMDEDDPSLPNPGATAACVLHSPRAPLSTGHPPPFLRREIFGAAGCVSVRPGRAGVGGILSGANPCEHACAGVGGAAAEKIGGFNSAMGSLWIVLSEMLKSGYNVIAQDADIVWLRDPRPAFSHSHGAPVTRVAR